MTTYLYRCGNCNAAFEATRPVSCRTPGCPGHTERVPGVAFHRSDPVVGDGLEGGGHDG